ncbi:peroxiredoxin [Mesomycoplasma hyopneumoniae]|uniref:Peroxiredoxin n=6 Tax=Mesomycoplasma hyopneumoniae TaxID=2099 RepID=A0A223M9N9_MESHO|nr:peroxiredoxin [Mesomycoplasma hyopneumoniae]AAV27807.1 thiol peroxidase, putative [Mesomycoplasma hyopneumoniae 232]AAZ44187.2 thiol peroxidase [Mesomycoplasma hyopneumoniae J]AAZ53473.2 thiol peroxidase [Mesomycoplasma hyopneumoniae 7448]ADQ90320.1 Thiol peroxidase [Mesomycoplasma hyopneumoniae 168]AGM21879.1 Thiol peroxidase [Mesomycoplasma hyopneumoniae 168-L]
MQTKFKNKSYNLVSSLIQPGQKLEFSVSDTNFDVVEFNSFGKTTLISVFPSINTKICDFQTVSIRDLSVKYPQFRFISVSLDLPSAIAQWKDANLADNLEIYSDYRLRSFGLATGFLIEDVFLLNRGYIIVDSGGRVLAVESNSDVHDQIDFVKLEENLKKFS